MMTSLTANTETVQSYERIARDYAISTAGTPRGVEAAGLRRLVAEVAPAASILELGSGPGWDADFVEAEGHRVRRTDAARAFCELQATRGKQAERLNAITDPYVTDEHPSYDAVMALCVLLHMDRPSTRRILAKVADALRPGGVFLVSLREGFGDLWEVGETGNRYHVTLWQRDEFLHALRAVDLEATWCARSLDTEGAWLTVLAHRTSDRS